MSQEWRNWAGDQRCTPQAIFRPRTLDGLRYSVREASERGLTIRAVGSGHSFTDVALTDGAMIRLEALDRVLDAGSRGPGWSRSRPGSALRT